MTSFKLKFAEQSIRKSVRFYWLKNVGSPYLFGLMPVTGFVGYRIVVDDVNWAVWVLSFGAIFYSVLMIILYIGYINQSLSLLRSMKLPEATLELEDEKMRITSDTGVTEIEWSSIRDIWPTDKVWFLTTSRHVFIALPVAELTLEAKNMINSRIESVLYRTHQTWKLRANWVCGYLSVIFILGPWLSGSSQSQWFVYSNVAGLIFAISALYFLVTVQCPTCRTRWFSRASRSLSSGRWPDWLLALKKCPVCGASDFGDKNNNGNKVTKNGTALPNRKNGIAMSSHKLLAGKSPSGRSWFKPWLYKEL